MNIHDPTLGSREVLQSPGRSPQTSYLCAITHSNASVNRRDSNASPKIRESLNLSLRPREALPWMHRCTVLFQIVRPMLFRRFLCCLRGTISYLE